MDWDDVRFFLALARAGSVRGAGASLGVSHSTVARRIEALEERFETRLFDRSRDGYVLTDAGRAMVESAERIEDEVATLERGLVGRDARLTGTVAVTCTDARISEIVVEALTPVCRDHPGIELAITVDARPFDLTKREADIAVRALLRDATPPEHLMGQRLAPITLCNYIARRGADAVDPDRASGADPRWIAFAPRDVHERMAADSSYAHVPAWGGFGSMDVGVQAARAGLGILMLPTYVGDADPTLRRLSRPDLRHMADLWLLSHPDLRATARYRVAREAIARAFSARRALFVGEG